jgi:hypothetical protein
MARADRHVHYLVGRVVLEAVLMDWYLFWANALPYGNWIVQGLDACIVGKTFWFLRPPPANDNERNRA